MSDIDRINHILSAIRNATAGKTSKRAATDRTTKPTPAPAERERPPVSDDAQLDGLKSQLAQNLAGLNLDTSEGERSARKLFVESVLLWELGAEFAGHANFGRIVAEVTDTFTDDPALKADIDGMLKRLAA